MCQGGVYASSGVIDKDFNSSLKLIKRKSLVL